MPIPLWKPRKSRRRDLVGYSPEPPLAGRNLAIHDEETGLFSLWFVEMRCTEECYRAARYKRPLTFVVLEVQASTNSEKVANEVAGWLIREGRRSDLSTSLGNGRFAIVMPETDVRGAHGAIARLCRFVSGLDAGLSSYPDDGANFEQLKVAATRRLTGIDLAT